MFTKQIQQRILEETVWSKEKIKHTQEIGRTKKKKIPEQLTIRSLKIINYTKTK